MVAEAVAALPPAKDGKDADPELVARLVANAVAALPAPASGKDADPEVIRSMVAEAVAALPPAKDGEPGKPGKLPIVRLWVDEVHYEGAVVTHQGSLWQALRDTGREPPHADWQCVARAGRDGEPG